MTRDFARDDGHERALVWVDLVHQRDQIGPRIPFDVELDEGTPPLERARDVANVLGRNVPPVSARMHGDAQGARGQTYLHGVEHARLHAATGVPQGRDLVDVDG